MDSNSNYNSSTSLSHIDFSAIDNSFSSLNEGINDKINPIIHEIAGCIDVFLKAIKEDERDFLSIIKAFVEGKDINDPKFEGLSTGEDIFKIVFACSDSKNWRNNIKLIINSMIPSHRVFIYVIANLCIVKGINVSVINNGNGFLDAKDAFIISLNCSDCRDFIKNFFTIFKTIKKEQREQNNIMSVLNEVIKENINNCQSFLDLEGKDFTKLVSESLSSK